MPENIVQNLIAAAHDSQNHELQIFHGCNLSEPVATMPFGVGFPDTPWACPWCGLIVWDSAELLYNVAKKKTD